MRIEVYKLIELMENHEAPKKIRIYSEEFELIENHYYLGGTYAPSNDLYYKMARGYVTLNDTVEILSKETWQNIEELHIENEDSGGFIRNEYGTKCYLTRHSMIMADKINQLIKNQKILKEMLENKDE